jgi:signal transduction histidine kinase
MALRNRISYQWRLFLPFALTLWLLIIVLTVMNNKRNDTYRREYIDSQLKFITECIIDAYDKNVTREPFLGFVRDYYNKSDVFENARVTVFDLSDWSIADTIGRPIKLSDQEKSDIFLKSLKTNSSKNVELHFAAKDTFYRAEITEDDKMLVITSLPPDRNLQKYLTEDLTEIWEIVVVIAVVITIISYFSTRYVGRNVLMLREFANRSANDPTFEPGMDFPHDELGEVARQIVTIFNERSKARQRMEHEHRIAMHAVEEKARQKRQLTNNINHELKTPLGVIRGYLEILNTNKDLDAEQREHFIAKALEHTNRLTALIADISAITRLDDGAGKIQTEHVDFHDLVYTFVNDIKESGALGRMDFIDDIPLGTYVDVNCNLMTGVLINLTKNSVNYSQGTCCWLRLISQDEYYYHFSFSDDGIGVGEEHLPYLFDRFYRVDAGRTRRSGGTGLGLAIVHNTILAHGGTIVARRADQGGLEIQFTLPRGT